jgi:putative endonuclease
VISLSSLDRLLSLALNLSAVIPGRGLWPASPESINLGTARVVYYVYILASRKHGTLYIGLTNDLVHRVYQHKTHAARGFTSRYGIHLLVWFECYDDVLNAIAREKELKKWRREWKINLIERSNPEWVDLYAGIAS